MTQPLQQAENLLKDIRGKSLTRKQRIEKTAALAAYLADATLKEKTHEEKKQEAWMARMMADPEGRAFITTMTDEVFRSHSAKRTANQLVYLLNLHGTPKFLPTLDRVKFLLFRRMGNHFPQVFIPVIRNQIRNETAQVLLPHDPNERLAYFKRCKEENIRLNINHLGEAILGENESMRRLKVYLEDLANPLIDYISVKISTIFSQINMVGFQDALTVLAERLRLLYRAAEHNDYLKLDGTKGQKFVNLDMEEYRDLDLTVVLFKKVLSEPEHLHTQAGIVLQSYLPDTYDILRDLTAWAIARKAKGGAPIKVRIVKGANLAMETVESSLRGWELAPYDTKVDTDANFKRMLEFACQAENAQAVHIGVGSHNLFEIAYAFILRAENGTEPFVSFEMLEGMAKPMRRAVQKLAKSILLYCPEAKEKDFHSAIAYLIRRLDENSGSENFLRHFFELRPGNAAWDEQMKRFTAACERIETVGHHKKRKQNRLNQPSAHPDSEPFKNEPDTDFSLPENRLWASHIFAEWENKPPISIPLVIAGQEIHQGQENGADPSRPQVIPYTYSLADIPLAEKALSSAASYAKTWAKVSFEERSQLLGKTAQLFRERRNELIGAMIADGGKTVWEGDPEVSEAIDFLEYYRKNWEKQLGMTDLQWSPKGTVLVTPPWNFPCSISVSGIAAALVAGNTVLFKPPPESILVGWLVAKAFWDAGIPREALQFITCPDDPVGSFLVKNPQVSSVVLTGATQTALLFLKMRPGIDLHAETGGKNAIIVTALSDRDLAVRDIVSSAFGHSGQKCSACSLAILEAEVYDDPSFKRQLADAVASFKVGSAWNPNTKITPLIRPPSGPLLKALTTLEYGESWLVEPRGDHKNPHLWSPGIKWGVQEKSFTHQTELFGPVLGVMRAESLQEAIRFANGTPYGLTSGLHSLDEREHEVWKQQIVAGNLYINRGITGAIVRRQPFGGCKASSFGSGAKAGGPNYVHQFAYPLQIGIPHEKAPLPQVLAPLQAALPAFHLSEKETEIWKASAESYTYWADILKEPSDPSSLYGQDNYFYLVPLERALARFEYPENMLSLLQAVTACLICKTPLEISSAIPLPKLSSIPGITVVVEEEKALFQRKPARIRLFSRSSAALEKQAAEQGVVLLDTPVLANGRIELLNYLREVSLSVDYHRYGYLGYRKG